MSRDRSPVPGFLAQGILARIVAQHIINRVEKSVEKTHDRFHGGAVRRSFSDMMQPDDAGRIDQHIASPLIDVAPRIFRESPPAHLLQIRPPGPKSPDILNSRLRHAVGRVELPLSVHQQRPGESQLLSIAGGLRSGLEGNRHDLRVSSFQLFGMLPQLQQMSPARQSAEVAEKHHKEPLPPEIFICNSVSFGALQRKRK